MVEIAMHMAIGFLLSALICIAIIPSIHRRALRLSLHHLQATMPVSLAEMHAQKDEMRAEFAMSMRRLEVNLEQLRSKSCGQLADIAKRDDLVNLLRKEIAGKTAAILAQEAREKAIRDQLRAAEEECLVKSGSIFRAQQELIVKEREIARLSSQLEKPGAVPDSQHSRLLAAELRKLTEVSDQISSSVRAENACVREALGQVAAETARLGTVLEGMKSNLTPVLHLQEAPPAAAQSPRSLDS
jgi:chromosome segregation ATPase